MYALAALIAATMVGLALAIVAVAYAFSVIADVNDRRELEKARRRATSVARQASLGTKMDDDPGRNIPSALERRVSDVMRQFSLKQRADIRRGDDNDGNA